MLKKIGFVVMIFAMTILFTGCGTKNVEGSLEELMTKVYENVPDERKPKMLENTKVTDENVEYYLGTKDIEYKEALASESGIGSIAHSVVLLRVKDGADVEKVKSTIKDKINPRKWICVGVEPEDVIVKSKGDLVILILVEDEENRNTIEAGFDNL